MPPGAEPFSFRADRQAFRIEGSRFEADGSLRIPKNQVDLVRTLLSEGAAHRGSWREREAAYEARIGELEQAVETHPDVLRARAFNQRVLAKLEQGPEAVAAWLDGYETNFPALRAEAEQDVLRADLEREKTQRATLEEEYEAQRLQPEIEGSIQGIVEELAGLPDYSGVDAGALYGRLMQHYLDRVCYEVPATARRMGLEQGEVLLGRSRDGSRLYVIDRGLIEDEFQHWARLAGSSATAAASAVQGNAAALASAVPPVAAGGGSAATPPGAPPLPKTAEETKRWIETGAWKRNYPGFPNPA